MLIGQKPKPLVQRRTRLRDLNGDVLRSQFAATPLEAPPAMRHGMRVELVDLKVSAIPHGFYHLEIPPEHGKDLPKSSWGQ
jgi:hypothetical protein